MVRKKGTALLMVYTDVDIEHDAEFNRWYNEEHVPERLSAPGFLDAARYEALKGGPRYLAVYELESVEALHSEEYLGMSNNPTPWTQRMSPNVVGRGTVRQRLHADIPGGGRRPGHPRTWHGPGAADRAHGRTSGPGGEVQRVLRHGPDSWQSPDPRMPVRPPLPRCGGRPQVLDNVRVRT